MYSYVDMSFQSRFYELRTQDSPHFSTMLYRASDLHRDRFEVTQCEGAEVALCFHKVMHQARVQGGGPGARAPPP